MDETGTLGPTTGNGHGYVPDVYVVEPGDDVLETGPDFFA
jgi:hypothetical protein